MGVSGMLQMGLAFVETLTAGVPASASPKVKHDGYNINLSLDSASTPPVTAIVSISDTLSGTTATLDLSNITGANGTYNLTSPAGQRIQILYIYNPSLTNTLRIEDHGTNGYPLFGDVNSFDILGPRARRLYFFNDYCDGSGNVLDATHKQLLLTGTSGQGYRLQIVVG